MVLKGKVYNELLTFNIIEYIFICYVLRITILECSLRLTFAVMTQHRWARW